MAETYKIIEEPGIGEDPQIYLEVTKTTKQKKLFTKTGLEADKARAELLLSKFEE